MIFIKKHLNRSTVKPSEKPEIEALIRQRNALLQESPSLLSLQEEIDTMLASTLDPLKRSEIIFMLISDKLNELIDVYRDLSRLTKEAFIQQ